LITGNRQICSSKPRCSLILRRLFCYCARMAGAYSTNSFIPKWSEDETDSLPPTTLSHSMHFCKRGRTCWWCEMRLSRNASTEKEESGGGWTTLPWLIFVRSADMLEPAMWKVSPQPCPSRGNGCGSASFGVMFGLESDSWLVVLLKFARKFSVHASPTGQGDGFPSRV
jgi:hypothetical protein